MAEMSESIEAALTDATTVVLKAVKMAGMMASESADDLADS